MFFFSHREVEMKPEAKKLTNNTKYCKAYRPKNLPEIRRKDKERKKYKREYTNITKTRKNMA